MTSATRITALAFGLGIALFGAPVLAQGKEPAMTGKTAMGPVLTDAKGMTLYVFDKDTAGKSTCNGPCAANWPPLMADSSAKPMGKYTVVTRDDGSRQWAYNGKPLYTWAKDAKAGDTTGDGVNSVWHVAKP
ncbi:putative lipoprotein with Yx(FWY)xxD motif [Azospirillum agricola]|uniref:COG4315 family predicted lipoprotein n=1 Tax=Azospirillum agricola TaxID=1720247 RepID=UPI001AE4BEA0|nr:hypothetical protein [Azospirillum agricola]MBP2227513.1 putative lipoprotein with Yx(FWY)xxD motif [Azospirillum agricola]